MRADCVEEKTSEADQNQTVAVETRPETCVAHVPEPTRSDRHVAM